jgi:hypothetical protein
MNYFAIQNRLNPEFLWCATDGWTDGEEFDLYTLEESETLRLPIDGQWIHFNNIIRH